jgi:hypothetical protein
MENSNQTEFKVQKMYPGTSVTSEDLEKSGWKNINFPFCGHETWQGGGKTLHYDRKTGKVWLVY